VKTGSQVFTETDNCVTTLAPNATCTITVYFNPPQWQGPGIKTDNGTVTIQHNAAGSPGTIAVSARTTI
jgi:hypothetical protein